MGLVSPACRETRPCKSASASGFVDLALTEGGGAEAAAERGRGRCAMLAGASFAGVGLVDTVTGFGAPSVVAGAWTGALGGAVIHCTEGDAVAGDCTVGDAAGDDGRDRSTRTSTAALETSAAVLEMNAPTTAPNVSHRCKRLGRARMITPFVAVPSAGRRLVIRNRFCRGSTAMKTCVETRRVELWTGASAVQ
jgi:hypothetical protein